MTTPLRAKYIRDLAIRGRAERTQQSYSRYVSELARYYHRSPELISYQEVADWLYYLIKERELSASSVNIAVNAVRFLYGVTLERNTDQLMASVPRMKHAIRRAEIYARSEVEAILSAPRQPRDRVFLMSVYACGLRLAEARHLKTTDIDRARMQLRVRKGKGGKGGKEVELPSVAAARQADPMPTHVAEQVIVGVSTRGYRRSLEPVDPSAPDGVRFATSSSSAARSKSPASTASLIARRMA